MGSILIFLLPMLLASVTSLPLKGTDSATEPEIAEPIIANGTSATIGYALNNFVYCWVNTSTTDLLHEYQVEWRGSGEESVGGWADGQRRFTVGSGIHVHHSYLVFTSFSSDLAGTYYCVLFQQGQEKGRASVMVS